MRSEKEVIGQIIELAEKDDSVRAVIRTDLKPLRKYLYSYDFYFVTDEVEKYDEDIFAECLGERILLYRGDKNYPEMFPNMKGHLMVFKDGVTIVINVIDKETFLERYRGGQTYENVWIGDTYQLLLDKDGTLPLTDRPEEKQTLFAEKPSEEEFLNCCSEFRWVMKTFMEYTLREELLSSMFYLNVAVRDLLNRMLRWYIYLKGGTAVDMGILDSNMEKLLPEEDFALYKKTYPDAEYEHILKAYDAVNALWHKAGCAVAECCGYLYPQETEDKMTEFIRELQKSKEDGR